MEERRRTTVIPHLFEERSLVQVVFAVLIWVCARWNKKCFREVEQHQIRTLRRKRKLDEQAVSILEPTPDYQPLRSAASAA